MLKNTPSQIKDLTGELEKISAIIRSDIIKMSHSSKAGHLASALSCVDILTSLYYSVMRINRDLLEASDRDRFILSKGHAAAALYAVLAHRGIMDKDDLKCYGMMCSLLEQHPSVEQNGVEATTGSLGHGLPIANGMALSSKISGCKFRVFVLMSDGECNEGSVWEAAMFANRHQLHNLTAIIDYNKWQATGRTNEVLGIAPLAEKWISFGWDVLEVDGHDHQELFHAMTSSENKRPRIIIAHTVKGKGVTFMEDDNNWHYRVPTALEVESARIELIGK